MMLMVDAWAVATRRTDGDTGSQARNMAEALQVPGGPGATEHDELDEATGEEHTCAGCAQRHSHASSVW